MRATKTNRTQRRLPLPPRPHGSKKTPPQKLLKTFQQVTSTPPSTLQRVNQELYKRNAELAVRNKTLATLRKLDEIALATVELADMAQKVTKVIAQELSYELVTLAIVDEKTSKLKWLALSSQIPEITKVIEKYSTKTITAPLHDGLSLAKAIQTNQAQHCENLHQVFPSALAEEAVGFKVFKQKPIIHSVAHPLRFGQKTLGALSITTARDIHHLSQFEKESISGVVGFISLALYKAQIYQDLQRTTWELGVANEQLRSVDRSKTEFLNIASHQLYTPLTALRGYLSMLREGDYGVIPAEQQSVIDILEKSTDRLIELVRNLLDISRIESGRLVLDLESIDVAHMIKEIVSDLLPNALSKKIKLELEGADQHIRVVGDSQRLRQVFLNIIDNAIKYTNEGYVKIKLASDNQTVTVAATDTGKGISAQEMSKLFTKFSRLVGAEHYHTEGSGLGLYVARQILREHAGEISAASPGQGQGSTFTIKLPLEHSPHSLKAGTKATLVLKTT